MGREERDGEGGERWRWRWRCVSCETECERSLDNPKRLRICFFCGRWFSKVIRKRDYEFPEPTLRRESTVKRESQRRNLTAMGRVST